MGRDFPLDAPVASLGLMSEDLLDVYISKSPQLSQYDNHCVPSSSLELFIDEYIYIHLLYTYLTYEPVERSSFYKILGILYYDLPFWKYIRLIINCSLLYDIKSAKNKDQRQRLRQSMSMNEREKPI